MKTNAVAVSWCNGTTLLNILKANKTKPSAPKLNIQ